MKVETKTVEQALAGLDALIVLIPAAGEEKAKGAGGKKSGSKAWQGALSSLPDSLAKAITAYAERTSFEAKPKSLMSFDYEARVRVVVVALPEKLATFELLDLARKALDPVKASCAKAIGIETRLGAASPARLADAFTAAQTAQAWEYKKTTGEDAKKKPEKKPSELSFFAEKGETAAVKQAVELSATLADATNLVRLLTKKVANELDCKEYVKFVRETAAKEGLAFEFTTQAQLEKMGAGAFVAVARGSAHKDAGIVKLTTKGTKGAKKTAKRLTLVGKGIVYDTGGTNLKPAESMFGMEGDMMGSALALALMIAFKRSGLPLDVTAYLAIADNAIGERAFRPNEVVKSLKGTTIETVHTDAEGRMVLADTLFLAAQEKPDLIVDFATLTGTCIRAIGTTYAGVFTNREELQNAAIEAGKASGERVWPFPLDEDFGECLESDVADIKQCRLKGGVDHIEAAWFLKHFVGEETPWLHVDLSPAAHTGGLAHVAGDVNGFGVRFATELVKRVLL